MADNASRTSSSLNGLMIAVTNFMLSPNSGQEKKWSGRMHRSDWPTN
jgi:hypothetical protein